jgi:hypothetical protein
MKKKQNEPKLEEKGQFCDKEIQHKAQSKIKKVKRSKL